MARWCDAFRIENYSQYLQGDGISGVYEFGFVRGKYFYPKYIGETKDLKSRFYKYFKRDKISCNKSVLESLDRPNFYVHYFKTVVYKDVEARLLYKHEIGKGSLYVMNKQYEYAPLLAIGWEFDD